MTVNPAGNANGVKDWRRFRASQPLAKHGIILEV